MSKSRSFMSILAAAVLTVVFTTGGCVPTSAPPPRALSSLEYFRVNQAQTMTTHGKVMVETAQEVDGKIQYQTDQDGKVRTWRVSATKLADGRYRYGEPVEVKE